MDNPLLYRKGAELAVDSILAMDTRSAWVQEQMLDLALICRRNGHYDLAAGLLWKIAASQRQ